MRSFQIELDEEFADVIDGYAKQLGEQSEAVLTHAIQQFIGTHRNPELVCFGMTCGWLEAWDAVSASKMKENPHKEMIFLLDRMMQRLMRHFAKEQEEANQPHSEV